MSILLVLVFFSILLILGFGFGAWTVSFIMVLLTCGLGIIMGSTDIKAVMDDWANRRCDIDILFASFLFKPSNDPRSASEFASNNFTFCVKSVFADGFKVLMGPLLTILGKQFEVSDLLGEMLNVLRTVKGNAMSSFTKILDPVWSRFSKTGFLFAQGFQRMLSAMNRVGGIAMATLYMGIGIQVAIQNLVDFIVNVVIIIMNILVALVAVMFLILWPLIPFVILPTVDMLEAAGFGDRLGGLRNGFCFTPEMPIQLADGSFVPIWSLKADDILYNKSIVEGVLVVDGDDVPLFSIGSVLVSGEHLVYSSEMNQWIPVKKHPSAILTTQTSPTLICLRTSSREIHMEGLRFRDWEEIPSGYDTQWDTIINHLLNNENRFTRDDKVPKEYPLIAASCEVLHKTGERRPISSVTIGDLLYGEDGYTRVTGIYKGTPIGERELSDGVWLKNAKWEHLFSSSNTKTKETGYHLTTDSGTFWVDAKDFSGFVRDFTEVGIDKIHLTYPFVERVLESELSKK